VRATIVVKRPSGNQRAPHFRLAWKIKACRHHAENRIGLRVDHEGLAQDVGVCAKAALPKGVAQNDNSVVRARLIVLGKNGPSEHRRAAQRSEKITGNEGTGNLRRLSSPGDIENPFPVSRGILDCSCFALKIEKSCVRDSYAGTLWMGLLNAQQPTAVLVGKWPDKDAVDNGKYGGCPAHA